jgi:uncharacterized protein (DUF2062 family)
VPPAADSDPSPRPGFWARHLVLPIRTQLTQGASPAALSRAVACGVVCGIFPILGTTGIVSTLVGMLFRLNQAVIQSLHWILYPAHLLLIPVYIRSGEHLFGAEPIPFSIPEALKLFLRSPSGFFAEFGMSCVHCVTAWAVTAPLFAAMIAFSVHPLIRRASRHLRTQP